MAKQQQRIFAGAGVLALAGIIAKILSAVYRVPFQNIVGNQGFYVYQQVYPIYGIGMVMALSGWPLFISKMVAEQPTQAAKQLVARRLFWLLTGISVLIFVGIYFGANVIANAMNDALLAPEIKAVAWMFLFMPVLATSRGYTQGQFNMVPTAISQVIEQVVRVAVILGVAWFGMQQAWNAYQIGTWATFGATIAAVATGSYLLGSFRQIGPFQRQTKAATADLRWRILGRRLWREGTLLAVLAALLVFLQLIDSFTIKGLLEQGGMASHVAETTKGVYDRGQPLVQLGMVVATGVGTALLPTLHAHFEAHEDAALKATFQTTLRITLIVSLLTAVGLIAIMPVINQFLFSSREGDSALMWYVTIIVPATLITVLASVLQSMNRTKGLITMIGVTLVLKYGLNNLLMPQFAIVGASVATMLALLPLLVYSMYQLPRPLWRGMFTWNWWFRVVGMLMAMMVVAIGVRMLGNQIFGLGRGASILTTILAAGSGAIVGVALLLRLKILNEQELLALPKGEKLVVLMKGKLDAIR